VENRINFNDSDSPAGRITNLGELSEYSVSATNNDKENSSKTVQDNPTQLLTNLPITYSITRELNELRDKFSIESEARIKAEDKLKLVEQELSVYKRIILKKSKEIHKSKESCINSDDTLKKSNNCEDLYVSESFHELRTPLNALIGFCELLLHEFYYISEVEKIDYLMSIQNVSHQISKIVKNQAIISSL